MSRGSEPWGQWWVSYDVYSHSILQEIQKRLEPLLPPVYDKVSSDEYHATIHPRFQFKDADVEKFENLVYDLFPKSIRINITEVYYFPSKEEPRIICMDFNTNIDFKGKQSQLTRGISDLNGENLLEPVNPHITLFRIEGPFDKTIHLPPNINEIYDTCDTINSELLPITISETQLQLKRM